MPVSCLRAVRPCPLSKNDHLHPRYRVRTAVISLDDPPAWFSATEATDHLSADTARAFAGTDGEPWARPVLRTGATGTGARQGAGDWVAAEKQPLPRHRRVPFRVRKLASLYAGTEPVNGSKAGTAPA